MKAKGPRTRLLPDRASSQDPIDPRSLLIALNACPLLSRDSICRLALRASPELELPTARRPGRDEDEEAGETSEAHSRVSRRDQRLARALAPHSPAVASRERALAERGGARIITLLDSDYPPILLELELPPPVLYVRGRIPRRPAIAIVGSRQADPYGREAAEMFARELATAGLTVVSGLARGVDTAAHLGALAAPDGRTVAVQGCGIETTYPRGNKSLAERIAKRGALVSEFPIGAAPFARNFPIRNSFVAQLHLL